MSTLEVDLLLQELKNVDWDILGTYLGLSQSEIRDIERDHLNTGRRRIVMLDKWVSKEENPSWVKIIVALEKMSETSLASQLRKKYQQQLHDENRPMAMTVLTSEDLELADQQAATRVLKVDRKDQVARELESLKESYARLVMSAESALETANPSSRQLKRFSQLYMSDRVVTTVEELFDCLGELSFLDHTLLENTISMFLKEAQPVVSDLSDYIQQLNNFKNSTTLNEFMETIENAQKSKDGTGACTVTLRLVGGWLTKTMEDLRKLLKEIFQDKSSILANLKIIRGSVIITYFAPQFEADSLVSLAKAKYTFMYQVGVCQLQIGATVVINAQNEAHSFESSLLRAVVDNDLNLLTFLLHINTNPDAIFEKGCTALMYGSHYGHHRAVSILLEANANPNIQRDDGVQSLHMAAINGHSYTVSILLQANADPNLQRDDGATPLHVAAQKGHSDTVSILLQANANPNFQMNGGVTPLHMAAQKGHCDTVSILLKAKANPNVQMNDGSTPLHTAAVDGHSDTVSILLQANANHNLQMDEQVTPLLIAAQGGHSDTVSILLRAKANPNFQRDDGVTPLYMAARNGHSDTVSILLQGNANPNLQADDGGAPLMFACLHSYPHIVQLLLTNGADPNVKYSSGFTALMCACRTGCLESTEVLLMSGADPSLASSRGLTALDIAVSEGHNDIIDLIQAIDLSQSSTTSPVLTATDIATTIDNEAMASLNKAMEDMLVAKAESYISTYYEKFKRTLPSKSDQENVQTIV